MTLTAGRMLGRGARRRCPICGQRRLFRRWVHMVDACPRCGLVFRREPGQWLGSWFLNLCLSQVVVIAILVGDVVLTWPEVRLGEGAVVAVGAVVAFPVWFFPYSRTLWTAVDLIMRPLDFDDGVAPGWELSGDPAAGDRSRDDGRPNDGPP